MKQENIIYFPNRFNLNNFITSLLIYDRIKCSIYTFIYGLLFHVPKKYHGFFVDLELIEIWDIYMNDPLEGWYDEMKCAYIGRLGYQEDEFELLVKKIRLKSHKYIRKNMDIELLKYLMMEENGCIGTDEWIALYDAIKILHTDYYSTTDIKLMSSAISIPDVNIDLGNNDIIFEINRFPDLTQDIIMDNFNFERFISLRDKDGAKLLREIIFKEKNYNHPEELLREYNDIVLREGLYTNRNRERAFWGLSNGLSVAGIFSGNIILTFVVTTVAILSGNHRWLYKSQNDKIERFIKKDLRDFINSITNNIK